MLKRNLNLRQVMTLKDLIIEHVHVFQTDKKKADEVFQKIEKYGVKTMPEAIKLYKENKHILKEY